MRTCIEEVDMTVVEALAPEVSPTTDEPTGIVPLAELIE
jgi:hypothetical protein